MIYEDRIPDSVEELAKKTAGNVFLPEDIDIKILRTLKYLYPKRKINVELTSDEFTCLCPYSGLPDFANLIIKYVPNKLLIEMKALKYYLYSYRNVKIYNEHVVNKVLEDLKKALNPHEITIIGEFTNRGGIKNKVCAQYKRKK